MAETKTRAPSGRGKTTKRKPAKARKPSTRRASNRSSSPKNGAGHADSAIRAVEETAKQAGHTVGDAGRGVGRAASKAKTPLLAGGAAVAGVAGGIALGARGRRSKVLPRRPMVKIKSRDLAKAAKEVGQFGVDVGQLATELRRNREAANSPARRSPIEVVLQGLTKR